MTHATPTNATPEAAAATAERYLAAWNERDATARRALLDHIWAEQARFVDPMASVSGRDAIDGVIGAVQQKFAGLRFTVHGTPQVHNDRIRFSWALGTEGAEPVVIGTDIGQLDADGRMTDVAGFFDVVNV